MAAPQEQPSRPAVEAVAEPSGNCIYYLRQPYRYGGGSDLQPKLDGVETSVLRFTAGEYFTPEDLTRVTLALRMNAFSFQQSLSAHNARLLALALLQAADDADGHAASLLTQAVLEVVPA